MAVATLAGTESGRAERNKPPAEERVAVIGPPETALAAETGAVERLLSLSGVSERQFDAIYRPLLLRLAGYVQRLPDPGAPSATLLGTRLRRAEQALARRRGCFLPGGASPEQIAREADLWTYVVFSAALLRRLGSDLGRLEVELCDVDHRPCGVWSPVSAGLAATGAVGYRVRQIGPDPGGDWTALLVAALMPAHGLCWLWREPPVLSCWLEAVAGETPPPRLAPLLAAPEPSTHQ